MAIENEGEGTFDTSSPSMELRRVGRGKEVILQQKFMVLSFKKDPNAKTQEEIIKTAKRTDTKNEWRDVPYVGMEANLSPSQNN